MKLTNKFNLPDPIVNAVNNTGYTPGSSDITVTQIIQPPLIRYLTKKHWNDLEEDVSARVWALFGTAIHHLLEMAYKGRTARVEERVYAEVLGWKIGGAFDVLEGSSLSDYKVTSVYSVGGKIEWEQQLNIYAWLVEKVKKTPVKSLEIIAIIRDWSRRDAQVKEGYPEAPIKVIDVPLWSFEDRENFIKERVRLHSNASFALETGSDLPECSPSEMWEKQTVWAVRKTGNVRAKAVCNTEEDAKAKLEELGKGYEIEVRQGERTRCANFCQVRDFCQQWRDYQDANNS